AQHLVAEAHPIHDAAREVLHHDVARGAETLRNRERLGLLHVEREALLALVVLVEVAAPVRSHLEVRERRQHARDADARRRLDAHDLGAEMRELERAVRAGPHPGEVGDADAVERSALHAVASATSMPSGPRISWLCWPNVGAGRRISQGVALKR